jgi:hypothetical protein
MSLFHHHLHSPLRLTDQTSFPCLIYFMWLVFGLLLLSPLNIILHTSDICFLCKIFESLSLSTSWYHCSQCVIVHILCARQRPIGRNITCPVFCQFVYDCQHFFYPFFLFLFCFTYFWYIWQTTESCDQSHIPLTFFLGGLVVWL